MRNLMSIECRNLTSNTTRNDQVSPYENYVNLCESSTNSRPVINRLVHAKHASGETLDDTHGSQSPPVLQHALFTCPFAYIKSIFCNRAIPSKG